MADGWVEGEKIFITKIDLSDTKAAENAVFQAVLDPRIREIRLAETLGMEERRFVANIVARNFPLMEI